MFRYGKFVLQISLFSLCTSPLLATHASAAVGEPLTGTIKVDGSSTVYPITEAVAEEFGATHSDVKVTVGISGTGGGFKKFCAGETDVSDASRPIKPAEVELCQKNKIEYVELPIAYDALTVVINPKNDWARDMTIADLKKMWEPEAQGKVMTWNQIRSDWPNEPIKLFGAGVDSGTYDYFTEAVVGKEHSSRGDFTSSEDDNVIVQGVANEKGALGFFGMSYYEENTDKIAAVKVDDGKDDNGKGPQMPSKESVMHGTYQPLSRPLFIYVRKDAIEKPEVKAFVDFYLANAEKLTSEVGYVALSPKVYGLASSKFKALETGSIFEGKGSQVGVTLEALMSKEEKKSNL